MYSMVRVSLGAICVRESSNYAFETETNLRFHCSSFVPTVNQSEKLHQQCR